MHPNQKVSNSQKAGIEDHPEILLKFTDSKKALKILKAYSEYIVQHEMAFHPKDLDDTDLEEYYLIDLKENIDPYKFVKKLSSNKGVEWVEENQDRKSVV